MADEGKRPTYYVPPDFFELQRQRPSTKASGAWLFVCKKCPGSKTVSASYKSRFNLKAHVEKRHSSVLKKFQELCALNDKRKGSKVEESEQPQSKGQMASSSSSSVSKLQAILYLYAVLIRLSMK